ncbi:MAG: lipoyl(octanoyl) transferase LipB [Phycisphaeraceae bacterium]|nr:lipoyl(octanoyl) transferase LipB [Phycisphaeraceae bacterium]
MSWPPEEITAVDQAASQSKAGKDGSQAGKQAGGKQDTPLTDVRGSLTGAVPGAGLPGAGVEDWGRVGYGLAMARQVEVHRLVVAGGVQRVILVEHDPVVTISQRQEAARNVLVTRGHLAQMGIGVEETNRGGDVTYHGPGQLVVYPIVRLNALGLNIGRYVRLLEEVVIETVGRWGVRAKREKGYPGVWVEGLGAGAAKGREAGRIKKLCAIGVRVERGVTMHGLALNVDPTMSHFQVIIPCGLAGMGVTSLGEILGAGCPPMDAVKRALTETMLRQFSCLAVSRPGT